MEWSAAPGERGLEVLATGVAETVLRLPGRADGLAPIFVDPATGALTGGLMTLGARGDSFYEYLLKQWLLGGKRQPALLQCAGAPSPHTLLAHEHACRGAGIRC